MRSEAFSEFLRELNAKTNLVELIQSYIPLKRNGRTYWACCPFHHEKTPSFKVDEGAEYYHCFGCGVSGNAITFVKEYENLDFMQAVQLLATRAKLEVPAFDNRLEQETAEKKRKKERLLTLMRDAARFYLNNLYSGRADAYLDYIAKRGISPSTAKKFGLGASTDFTGLPAHLLAQGYTKEECVDSGACTLTDDGRLIDAEGGRLIVPIINHMDEVIAFGGRVIRPTDRAKYKNTRETVIFNKGRTLYNLNLVKKEKRAGSLTSLIMVEGYMDVISLYEAGFKNAVANMGTSLTKEHAKLCRRYSENLFVSYDGDFAGQKANLRGLDIFKEEGINMRVVPLPDGLDPDDVIRQQGAEGYQKCLDKSMPIIDFRLLYAQRKYNIDDPYERRKFVKEALPIVREAESATEKEELLRRVAEVARVSYAALARDLEALPPQEEQTVSAPAAPKEEATVDRERKAARVVLAACLLNKPYALQCDLASIIPPHGELGQIADFITESRKHGAVRTSGIFEVMSEDSAELSAILNLDFEDNLDGENAEKYFNDCVNTLEKKARASEIAALQERLKIADSKEEITELLNEIEKKRKGK